MENPGRELADRPARFVTPIFIEYDTKSGVAKIEMNVQFRAGVDKFKILTRCSCGEFMKVLSDYWDEKEKSE